MIAECGSGIVMHGSVFQPDDFNPQSQIRNPKSIYSALQPRQPDPETHSPKVVQGVL